MKHGVHHSPRLSGGRFPRRTRRGLIEAQNIGTRIRRGWKDFPGGHAGASLKQGRAPEVGGGVGGDFPGGHAGASLKPIYATHRTLLGQDFPGGHAGASLKRTATAEFGGFPTPGFPRRTRRGLIEATSSSGEGSARSRRFPRRTRRGLIEATVGAPAVDGSGYTFPRRTRRGLIEAFPGRRAGPPRPEFPRRTRRGLIEAPWSGCPRFARRGFPRRTRRGLIEAQAEPRIKPCHAAHFPGGHAGASLKRLPARSVRPAGADISPADTPGPH